VRYSEEVTGTIARDDAAGELRYVGRGLRRRVSGAYRGMTQPDQGQICTWLLDLTASASVTLRAVDDAWDLSIESRNENRRTSNGSCPASQVMPGVASFATTVLLEGPVPFDRSMVYREGLSTRRIALAFLDVCEDTDERDGPKDARADSIRDAVADGLNTAGASAGGDVVSIRHASIDEFSVRLGSKQQPLPNRACLEERIKAGEVGEAALQGATHLLVGGVQESGGRTRVTVRVTDVATGAVVATGKADASGPDALGSAARDAIAQLGWTFGR
jgi:hypothetical protein